MRTTERRNRIAREIDHVRADGTTGAVASVVLETNYKTTTVVEKRYIRLPGHVEIHVGGSVLYISTENRLAGSAGTFGDLLREIAVALTGAADDDDKFRASLTRKISQSEGGND